MACTSLLQAFFARWRGRVREAARLKHELDQQVREVERVIQAHGANLDQVRSEIRALGPGAAAEDRHVEYRQIQNLLAAYRKSLRGLRSTATTLEVAIATASTCDTLRRSTDHARRILTARTLEDMRRAVDDHAATNERIDDANVELDRLAASEFDEEDAALVFELNSDSERNESDAEEIPMFISHDRPPVQRAAPVPA
jgi:predicted  nucleic acid-binding Zn-ribbon protein